MARNNIRILDTGLEQAFNRLMAEHPQRIIHPDNLLKAAENPSSPFHRFFTWNDDEAAEKWRKQEARMLLASYTVYNEELKINVRAFTALNADREDGGGYRWMNDVMRQPSLRAQMIEQALKDLDSARDRYAHLTELTEIWEAIDAKKAAVEAETEKAPLTKLKAAHA